MSNASIKECRKKEREKPEKMISWFMNDISWHRNDTSLLTSETQSRRRRSLKGSLKCSNIFRKWLTVKLCSESLVFHLRPHLIKTLSSCVCVYVNHFLHPHLHFQMKYVEHIHYWIGLTRSESFLLWRFCRHLIFGAINLGQFSCQSIFCLPSFQITVVVYNTTCITVVIDSCVESLGI